MTIKKEAPANARGQESKNSVDKLYPTPTNKSRGNHNSSGLSVRELLGYEAAYILLLARLCTREIEDSPFETFKWKTNETGRESDDPELSRQVN